MFYLFRILQLNASIDFGELVESSISQIQAGIGLNCQAADKMGETVKKLINQADLFNAEINKVKIS